MNINKLYKYIYRSDERYLKETQNKNYNLKMEKETYETNNNEIYSTRNCHHMENKNYISKYVAKKNT